MAHIVEDEAFQKALEERDKKIEFLEGRIDYLESLVLQYLPRGQREHDREGRGN